MVRGTVEEALSAMFDAEATSFAMQNALNGTTIRWRGRQS